MLKQRVMTAAIGLLIIIGAIESPSAIPWHIIVWLSSVLGMVEFSSMFGFSWRSPLCWLGGIFITMVEWLPQLSVFDVLFAAICAALVVPVLMKNSVSIKDTAVLTLGTGYIAYGGMSLICLRGLNHGIMWIWLFMICIWLTDTAAFFVGRKFGGQKLWPSISPKKTISGAIGGMVAAALGAWLFGYLTIPNFDPIAYIVTGLVISLAGQFGDLIESAYKRVAGVKDSGKLLPGHGGMLDRIDSLLFAAPFTFYLITTGAPTWFQ